MILVTINVNIYLLISMYVKLYKLSNIITKKNNIIQKLIKETDQGIANYKAVDVFLNSYSDTRSVVIGWMGFIF